MGWEGSCGGAGIPWSAQGFAVLGIRHTLDSWIPEVFPKLRDSVGQASQSCRQSPEDVPHGTAWDRLCLRAGRTPCESWISCSISPAKANSLWLPGEFPCGFTRMPRGQESAHRKDFPAEKAQLDSAFTTNQTRPWHLLPSTSRNFIRPYFSHTSLVPAEVSDKMH